jgi:hypothetical protein
MTMLVTAVGKDYEARLRQQHSRLNPRTSWAARNSDLRGRKRRHAGYGQDSEDDECVTCFLPGLCRLSRALSVLSLGTWRGCFCPLQSLISLYVFGCSTLNAPRLDHQGPCPCLVPGD